MTLATAKLKLFSQENANEQHRIGYWLWRRNPQCGRRRCFLRGELGRMKDEYDFLTGWGEGIESGCIEDERPDL
ncbi:hypothetical protein P7_291 [Pectobacterium phage vB_PcaM_P7_Pc]|nr:hypothetical protein P7_291 [Pectobacterium phage vB_PcaM_P7_Pc]